MEKSNVKSGMLVLPKDVPTTNLPDTHSKPITISPLTFPGQKEVSNIIPLYVLQSDSHPGMVLELVRFKQPYGSWFCVPENAQLVPELCSNGNLTIVTKVDPLFCALIIMDAQRLVEGKPVFQPLDALSITSDGTNISLFCPVHQFEMLCDVKHAAGQDFYRLNDEKALQWLQQKHHALSAHPTVSDQDAVDVISQYLTRRWTKLFKKAVGQQEAPQFDKNANAESVDLAMAIMMEDAKTSNEATRAQDKQYRQNPAPSKRPPTKQKKKQPSPPSSAATAWWTSRQKGNQDNTDKTTKATKGAKRTRSSFATK